MMTFWGNLKYYLSPQVLSVGFLGFASGLPILMTLSTLTYWLAVYDINKSSIALMSLAGLPYVFKFMWAPFLDSGSAPFLKNIGRRKSWILLFQLFITLIFFALAFVDPHSDILIVSILVLMLSTASASQDIVIDAYRIDTLSSEEQPYGSSLSQVSYRVAMLIMGAGVLFASDYISWQFIFLSISALFFLIFMTTFILIKEESALLQSESSIQSVKKNMLHSYIIEPFIDFITRPQAVFVLIFILLYKMPDAIAGVLATVFYKEMGFTGAEIGLVSKVYGLIATLLGAFFSAQIITRINLYKALVTSVLLMGVTNLGYILIYNIPTLSSLTIAISLENFIGGYASAVFITYLSLLCNKQYSATQYAMLSALAAFSLRVLGSFSGFAVDDFGWQNFFIFTALLALPAFFVLPILKRTILALSIDQKNSNLHIKS